MRSRHLTRLRAQAADRRWLRAGAATLGLFAGMAIGLVAAVLLVRTRVSADRPDWLVFAGGALGAMLGAWRTDAGVGLFEALLHFLIGVIAGSNHRRGTIRAQPNPRSPWWLRIVFAMGLACGLVAAGWWRWRRHSGP